ncbi:MAG: hypothetical protein CVV64_15265 [Candidatus Wallbacteria bacterium HGW-Wallbacteria-1]|jgi:phosphatidylserine/phosphatidylglycerophosphate/cardiolipin synthase-like enzyme|uniref:PLD phosphodiesterase domain-containing protein n=1 Tax=Candidatus Wallbacteria bacterium HGW-Wallbacteria-1 TaxID=2013854 RepID=A0A2N1PLQ8_9BACT|nr:MAG: hypothetical protein CVV64_15265 [Candidatus Wallbacteria bacterium HGW-Wallbacteria-1]
MSAFFTLNRMFSVSSLLLSLVFLAPGAGITQELSSVFSGISGISAPDLGLDSGSAPAPTQAPAVPDTQTMLLDDNNDAWLARWHVIEKAEKTLDIVYFALFDDAYGRAFMGLLHKKAREGVKIRMLIDYRGGAKTSNRLFDRDILVELSRLPNVEIKIYNPVFRYLPTILTKGIKSVWTSNHDKLVIADGQWLITGGRNIWFHFFTSYAQDPKAYVDTDVLFRGTRIAAEATMAFESEYLLDRSKLLKPGLADIIGREKLRRKLGFAALSMGNFIRRGTMFKAENENDEEYNKWLAESSAMKSTYGSFLARHQVSFAPDAEPLLVRLIDKTSRFGGVNGMTDALIAMVNAAKKTILIQNPYVIIPKEMKSAIIAAANRGVAIRIFTASPNSSDEPFVQGLFVNEWKDLIRDIPGVRLFVTLDRPLHSKVFVFDGEVSVVGTYNLDALSQNLNSEVASVIFSKDFSRSLMESIDSFQKDFGAEYILGRDNNGNEVVVFGPENHCPPEKIRKLQGTFSKLARIMRNLL